MMFGKKLIGFALALVIAASLVPYTAPPAAAAGDMGKAGYYNKISIGMHHNAAIAANGDLYTWGGNYSGKLGLGDTTDRADTTDRLVPTRVPGLSNVVEVSLGDYSSAAVTANGDLYTWGSSGSVGYNLGLGDAMDRHTPTKVPGLSGVVSVSLADSNGPNTHGAAITAEGHLYTWGNNGYGQLGLGDTTDRQRPERVALNDVVAVATGAGHTAAITANGDLYFWGGVWGGGDRSTPIKMQGISNVAAVALGGYASFITGAAITVNGDLYMWQMGYNRDESVYFSTPPEKVRGLSNVVAFSMSLDTICAITANGNLFFAYGSEEVYGVEEVSKIQSGRIDRSGWAEFNHNLIASSSTSYRHAMLTADGELYMWGSNSSFGLGDGTTSGHVVPVLIMSGVATPDRRPMPSPSTGQKYTITAVAGTGGTVSGGGEYQTNSPVTLTATPDSGWDFDGWFENDRKISTDATLSFTAATDRTLEARFVSGRDIYIYDAADLAAIGGPDSAGKTYILANPINYSGRPIEDFRGTLDGAGHVITLNVSANSNGGIAGLFGLISTGDVTIKNLGVEGRIYSNVGTRNTKVALYAGGLIGWVAGGNVRIENCYFNGNINVQSRIFDHATVLPSLVQLGGNFVPSEAIVDLMVSWAVDLGFAIFDLAVDDNSYAYAGGLIGLVNGFANVNISNSYTRGSIYAWASTHHIFVGLKSHAHAGGLVGKKTDSSSATLNISRSYSTANVTADSAYVVSISNPYRFAGGLLGRGSLGSTSGNNYRLSSQIVKGQKINNAGTALSNSAMQSQSSFNGWVFNANAWTRTNGKNSGYPYLSVFDNSIIHQPEMPFSAFQGSFSSAKNTDTPVTLDIDKPFSLFDRVSVNGNQLVENVHFTVMSGSTQVTLLPRFLETLDDGFHSLKVTFKDGVSVEEQFIAVDTDEMDIPPVSKIFIEGRLIYSDGELLVEESFFESLVQDIIKLRVEFTDGSIIEETFNNGLAEQDLLRFVLGDRMYTKNGAQRENDVAPYLDSALNRTMVPLRVIAEEMGAIVDWDGATQTVSMSRDGSYMSLVIGQALPDGMGTAVIAEDRTFVPVRYVAEMLGAEVEWDGANQAVYISF